MKKIRFIAIATLAILVASCGSSSKKANNETNADDSAQIASNEHIPALETPENDTKTDEAVERTIFMAYFDPMLTDESERVYSADMIARFKKYGFKNEVKRTDLMSDDLKATWESFNNLDPEAVMEFLDWDLFYCGQDVYELRVTVEKVVYDTPDRAEATLKVVNSDQMTPVSIKLIKNTADEWKIDDITWQNGKEYIKQPMKTYVTKHK